MRFDQFSPQAFERLTQALCAHVLGPGTLIFGAGPDGAREATFDGEVPFPSAKKRWNGYVVMQAKCREGLKQDHRDADWVCEQLKADLDKFLDPARNLRKPQYYLLATNVTLSPKEKAVARPKSRRSSLVTRQGSGCVPGMSGLPTSSRHCSTLRLTSGARTPRG